MSAKLCELGFDVTGIDWMKFYEKRKNKNLHSLSIHPNFSFIEGDIRSDLPQESFDYVIHLAALAGVRASIERPGLTMDVNVSGTATLLKWAVESSTKAVIYASSSSVYGISKEVPWKENNLIEFPNSPYAVSKVTSEMLAKTYSRLFQIKALGLRFFTVYGPGGREDMAMHKFLSWVSQGNELQMFGDGSSMRDYTYVDDIVDGILKSMEYIKSKMGINEHEVFNLGNNTPHRLSDLIKIVEDVTKKKAIIEQLPDQLGDVPITYADLEKSIKRLGYSPKVDLKVGVTKTWEYMQHLLQSGD